MTYGTFTEIVGTFARRRPEVVGAMCLVFLRPLEWLVAPLADPLAIIGRAVGRRVPKSRNTDARITETEVEWVVSEGEKAGAIANEPAEMIRKVLDFKDLTAPEVMVPRRHILGLELGTPLVEVVALVAAEKHSRYPVYRETLDNVVGLLYAKDLFAVMRDGRLETTKLVDIIRTTILFVSEHQSAAKILQDMRSRRLHMAIVSDEFGGTAGLVTLEDIIEEIVGDIRDEHDVEAPIQSLGEGRVMADGLETGINRLSPGGGTALFDAVYTACRQKLLDESRGQEPVRKAIILLSDGDDNQSRVYLPEAIKECQRAETIIYSISTNWTPSRGQGDKVMAQLAEDTGGQVFFPPSVEEVSTSFHDIEEELRSQYALTYTPADFKDNGAFRTIYLYCNDRRYQVRAKKGYFAPRN